MSSWWFTRVILRWTVRKTLKKIGRKSIQKLDKKFTTYTKYFHTLTINPNLFQVQTNRSLQIMNTYLLVKVKVKCPLVQALRLCTGHTAHRGSRGIALPFHDHSTRRGWGVSITPRPLFTPPGKTRYPLYRRLVWPQGQSGQVRKIWPPTGIPSPDHPARSQSLYQLSYPVCYLLVHLKN
jgi:hypothetical protein